MCHVEGIERDLPTIADIVNIIYIYIQEEGVEAIDCSVSRNGKRVCY